MTKDKTELTIQDCLAGAFQAILRGDTAARDVLCAMVEKQFGNRKIVPMDEIIVLGDKSGN